jgi:hypothetical protein
MTSVLFGGGLNYQRNNPLGAEVRAMRTDIESLRKLVEDLTYRLDKADIAKLPEESAPAPATAAPAPAPAPASAPTGGSRRR